MNDDSIARRGHAMEEAFFRGMDAKLLEQLRHETATAENRSELIRKTGIQDETLLNELLTQGISSESIVALRLIPMVMVAWADRDVSPEESNVIHCEAEKIGITKNSIACELLNLWLKQRPESDLIDTWKGYTELLFKNMPSASQQAYREELKRELEAVARASGGVLGFGSISDSESSMIERLIRSVPAGA